MKPRYYIEENYPFSKFSKGDIVLPTKKEVVEFEKYPHLFKDVTVLYKVLKRDDKGYIVKVKCLVSNRIFKVGDEVIYKLKAWDYYCGLTISGFKELDNIFKDVIYVCYNSKEHDDNRARACGLSLVKPLTEKSAEFKIEPLK